MIAALEVKDWLVPLAVAILTGGAVQAASTWRKTPAEVGSLNIEAAERVLRMQELALGRQEKENEALAVKVAHLEESLGEWAQRFARLAAERDNLAAKVVRLEHQLAEALRRSE